MRCFRTSFDAQRAKGSQTLQNSAKVKKWSLKLSILVRSEILELFVNRFSADARYSSHNLETFSQPIQIHLS